ncbi:MAG TPA: folylpolyglutamate synthase/dihydrofolate synthase family protein [Vicinamibacteria bacterium]|nr:folylpolyglutamate synthase/dihydrofolate synthase family protein [Vicinamibacteria bacterium]
MALPAHRVAGLYLARRVRFGMKFGLETMRALVAEMGHPERAYPTLLVAGTNGKGSVAAYCDAALRASGLRTGRYTSPHLVRVNERIAVDGRDIGDPGFEAAVRAVRDAAERLVRRGVLGAHPTFFEVLTAAAFAHFRRERVDAAVLEVGLGGRLDATNVAEPLASAIVSIDLDHEVYLGRTLAAIAREKAGVMRPGRSTVVGPLSDDARRVVRARAREVGARLVEARRGARTFDRGEGRTSARAAATFGLVTPTAAYPGLRPLPGAHQRDNLIVAVRLLEEAKRAGIPIDLSKVPEAVARTRWPGRLERVPGDPPLLLDGAHNPAGARALAAHLADGPPFVLVFGAMADKDVAGLARALFPLAAAVVLTRPRVARAATPSDLARRAGRLGSRADLEPSVARALALARGLARARGPGTVVVVAGSLYLVGAVKAILERRRGS